MVSSLLLTCMLLTQARQVPGKPSCKNSADFCEDPEDYPIHEDLTSEVLQKRRVRRTIQATTESGEVVADTFTFPSRCACHVRRSSRFL